MLYLCMCDYNNFIPIRFMEAAFIFCHAYFLCSITMYIIHLNNNLEYLKTKNNDMTYEPRLCCQPKKLCLSNLFFSFWNWSTTRLKKLFFFFPFFLSGTGQHLGLKTLCFFNLIFLSGTGKHLGLKTNASLTFSVWNW